MFLEKTSKAIPFREAEDEERRIAIFVHSIDNRISVAKQSKNGLLNQQFLLIRLTF